MMILIESRNQPALLHNNTYLGITIILIPEETGSLYSCFLWILLDEPCDRVGFMYHVGVHTVTQDFVGYATCK